MIFETIKQISISWTDSKDMDEPQPQIVLSKKELYILALECGVTSVHYNSIMSAFYHGGDCIVMGVKIKQK